MNARAHLSISLIACFAIACGGGNNEPPDAYRPDGGPRDAYVAPSDGGADVGIDAASEVDADVDANLPDANLPDAGSCDDPTGCYRCPPTNDDQFLDHCTAAGVDCEPFPVTVARLPLLRSDGTVPPLP